MHMLVHISQYIRSSRHVGGVEKGAWYLQRMLPGLELISVETHLPNYSLHRNRPDWEQAALLSQHLLETHQVGAETIVIGDGFWGINLAGKVAKVINICHGLYIGVLVQHQIYPWGADEDWLWNAAQAQGVALQQADVVVAIAPQVARELELFYGIEATLVYQACDLDVFVPPKEQGDLFLEVAGASAHKGKGMLTQLRQHFPIEYLNVHTGDIRDEARRWQQGRIAILPTHYEGGPRAVIEAAACGVPVVGYRTGLLADLPPECGVVIDDYSERSFIQAIHRVLEGDYNPRAYAERHHNMIAIAEQWRALIGV